MGEYLGVYEGEYYIGVEIQGLGFRVEGLGLPYTTSFKNFRL